MSRKQYFRKQKLFGLGVIWCGIVMMIMACLMDWASLGLLAALVIGSGFGIRRSKEMIICA